MAAQLGTYRNDLGVMRCCHIRGALAKAMFTAVVAPFRQTRRTLLRMTELLASLLRTKTKAQLSPRRDGTIRHELLKIDGRLLEVRVRLNPRAHRMIVKVNPATGEVSVTVPSRRGVAHALEFARGQKEWIAGQLAKAPGAVALMPGTIIPFRGRPHEIRSTARGSSPVWCEDGIIWVRGGSHHVSRRVVDFLKRQARTHFEARAMEFAARLSARPSRITVRDTATRWGSCSSARSLSFSWRLILAPEFVLDYVVAHEVAHLREMNHSSRFWEHVKSLIGDLHGPQAWLRQNGRELQRYAADHR